MLSIKSLHFFCNRTIAIFLAMYLPTAGMIFCQEVYAGTVAQASRESERTYSNHGTQVSVNALSNIKINTWNGGLAYSVPAIVLPSHRAPTQLSLSYISSWHNSASHYGYGWQLNYNMFYARIEKGDIIVVWEGGADKFIKDGDSFLPPLDTYSRLREYQPDRFVLRTKEGMEYYFDNPIHKRVTRRQDPNGNILSFSYNTDMQLTKIIDAAGRKIELSYANGNLSSIADASASPKRSVYLQYDANNNLVGIKDPLGNQTKYSYNSAHRLTSITPPIGAPTTITYEDGAAIKVGNGLTTKAFTYDQNHHITTVTNDAPVGEQYIRFLYDNEGRINNIEDAFGNSTTATWDARNNLTGITDGNGNSTSYTYDGVGNLLSVIDALGNTTQYTYEDAYNKLTSIVDANGHTSNYAYDAWGNLVKETDPLSHVTSWAYNERGEHIGRTDANGVATAYVYDDAGNLIATRYPDGSEVNYSYDGIGNITGMTNADVQVLYTYDTLNRVTQVKVSSHGKTISYEYDARGNRTRMIDPDGGITTYEYDAAGRLERLTNPLKQTTAYTYDGQGRLVSKTYHNGTNASYQYDRAWHLLSLVNRKSSGEVVSSYAYEYDAAGNRTKMTEADGGVTYYGYDKLNQLTDVTYPDGATQRYTYDAVGNRLALADSRGTTVYHYDNADRLLSAGATTYSWDNNGNMISKADQSGTTSHIYDYENRLIRVIYPDNFANAFRYYPNGSRLSKVDSDGATIYFYDGFNTIMETTSNGSIIARYTSGLGIDDWISMDKGASTFFYHKDVLGSVMRITNAMADIAAEYEYEAFGATSNQMTSDINDYRFTGREYDEDAKLYYCRARMYDAASGRFISPDPFNRKFFKLSVNNSYNYTANSPVSYRDPLGLSPDLIGDILVDIATGAYHDTKSTAEGLGRIVGGYIGYDLYGPVGAVVGGIAGNYIGCAVCEIPTTGYMDSTYNTGFEEYGIFNPNTTATSSGSDGGTESKPLLNVIPSYYKQPNPSHTSEGIVPSPKTSFWESISNFFLGQPAFAGTQLSIDLKNILPQQGPAGTNSVTVRPQGPFEIKSNAADVMAIDFIDPKTSLTKGSVFVTKTIGEPYEHDYHSCNLFLGYTLETAAALPLPGVLPGIMEPPWFWHLAMTKDKLVEETFIFAVFVNETAKTLTVNSQWLTDLYSVPAKTDYILNFQIWSSSAEEAYNLLRRTLINLTNVGPGWSIKFASTTAPPAPTAFITSAELVGNRVTLRIRNWSNQTTEGTISGAFRSPNDPDSNIPFSYPITLHSGYNTVDLPLGNIRDTVVDIEVNGFKDRAYIGSGYWYAFKNEGGGSTSSVTLTPTDQNCALTSNLTARDLVLAGCPQMTGSVGSDGWVGVARTLNPNDLPVDVSQYQALTFFAKGDGKSYRVNLETASVRNAGSADFHQFVFTATPEWKQFVIPLAVLAQQGWDANKMVPFTGKDVISVAWMAISAPHESINLSLDRVGFFNSTLITETTFLLNTVDVVGPYSVNSHIADDQGVQSTSLLYSVNNGFHFSRLPMTVQGNSFSASIPGQPLGTAVRYYVEAMDADGNVATDPVDVPYKIHRFQVSQHPYLLVDDFMDTDPQNLLGDNSGAFKSSSGKMLVRFDKISARLDYDVSVPESYAGYYSLLHHANLTGYNAVSFLVRGSVGGEKAKIGLRNFSLKETKLPIESYLPTGISTSWQKVIVPLSLFTGVGDWSDMENMSFSFENWIGSGKGTVYIDDLKFEYFEARTPGTPLDLSGNVYLFGTSIPVCALVLANGKSMFSCDGAGSFSLTGVPVDENEQVTLFAWADGFIPYKSVFTSLSPVENRDITMLVSPCGGTGGTDIGPNLGITGLNLSGKVYLSGTDIPVCAMVLANGQSMFSCDGAGNYSFSNLLVDTEGMVTLFTWADGFLPSKWVFTPTSVQELRSVAMRSTCN